MNIADLTQTPFVIIAAAIAALAALLLWLHFDLRRQWLRVFGKKPKRTRESTNEIFERLGAIEAKLAGLEPRTDALEAIDEIAVQKVGFLRFNPFSDTGGDQSFAVALLDRADNGVIISSLYTRDGVRVYAKEIRDGRPKHPLSEEEEKALMHAVKKDST